MPGFRGKKYLPNPDLRRSGILPRGGGDSSIGNKTLLRFIDSLLQLEGVRGTPAILETTDVKPVIDLGRFIAANSVLPVVQSGFFDFTTGAADNELTFFLIDVNALEGASTVMDPGFFYKLMALELRLTLPGVPTESDRVEAQVYAGVEIVPDGADQFLVMIAGGDLGTAPLSLEDALTTYRWCLGGPLTASDGTVALGATASANPNHFLFFNANIPPIGVPDTTTGGQILAVRFRHGTPTGALSNWAAGTQFHIRYLYQKIPFSNFQSTPIL